MRTTSAASEDGDCSLETASLWDEAAGAGAVTACVHDSRTSERCCDRGNRCGKPSPCQNNAPTKQAAAMGTQYFQHVVMTWSIRRRGNVQRTHIMTVTPMTALSMKLTQPARLAR